MALLLAQCWAPEAKNQSHGLVFDDIVASG